MRKASLALLLVLGACATETTSTTESPLCAEAAAHMDECFPGMETVAPETCSEDDATHSQWVIDRSCDQLLLDAGDGKADGVPQLEGVRIRREGNLTYFSIPLARTAESDRKYLFESMITKFAGKMAELNGSMKSAGIDMSGVLTGSTATDYLGHYADIVNGIAGNNVSEDMAVTVGETVQNPKKLSAWQRYLIPQAFIAYFSARFSANIGVGGGVSATVMLVVQPWMTLAVDHTLAQPKIVAKSYDVDMDVLGVPNVDIGFGGGGGPSLRVGVGAVFGPLDKPSDIAGTGIGFSGGGTIPILGGLSAKVITVLKYPPLIMLMVGYSSGTAAEVEVHGNLQQILDLNQFLAWIHSLNL
ncbi:MAG TPA: hypothetical protein VGM39_10725 [Kofleriaceae bacterium]|jgi:hypothetical protein